MLLPFCYSWLAILVLTFGIICRIFGKVRTHKIKNCDRPFLNSRLSVHFVQTFSPNRASKTSPKNNKKPAKKPPNLFLNRVLKTISKKKRAPGKQFLGTLSESFLLDNEHFSDGQAQKLYHISFVVHVEPFVVHGTIPLFSPRRGDRQGGHGWRARSNPGEI